MNVIEKRMQYYGDTDVRARILEFIGAATGGESSCEFLTASDDSSSPPFKSYSPQSLNLLLDCGFEICRSLWDRTGLIADFDIEYVNFDNPAEAFVEPERVFAIQQPVQETIERLLQERGIEALHVLSGRGHHFIWRIEQNSTEFKKLAELGSGPPSLWAAESEPHPPNGRAVQNRLARGFAGLGLVMEFLAHRVKQIAALLTKIPVELTAVEVGPSEHGREMISIDISEYGDPLYSRVIRVPFSVYLKPWQQPWAFASEVLTNLQPLCVIPLQGIDWRRGISAMRDLRLTAKLAEHTSTRIPDATRGTGRLLSEYQQVEARQSFTPGSTRRNSIRPNFGRKPTTRRLWRFSRPARASRSNSQTISCCGQRSFASLSRVMLALGWHPRHIAGLICSKYKRDFDWTQFANVDPATRADFYTRVFSGLFAAGTDDLVDFNCVSAQEQATCTFSNCGFNLLNFKESALERRAHDKLGHRPFNRLLLSSEHS